jgi:hypothetical protein
MDSVVVPHSEGPAPLLTVIMRGSPLGEGRKAPPDVSQTWDWDGAEAARALPAKPAGDWMFGESGRRGALGAMSRVVAEPTQLTQPIVLSWPEPAGWRSRALCRG